MQFRHDAGEYAKNLENYFALNEISFLPTDSKEEVIERLKEISREKRVIAEKQNDILAEYIEPFEKKARELDEESAKELTAFFNSLVPKEKGYLDPPILLRLCRLLYAYYQKKGDRERAILVISVGAQCEVRLMFSRTECDFLSFPKLCEEYFAVFEELSPMAQKALLETYAYRHLVTTKKGYQMLPKLYPQLEKRIRACIDLLKDKEGGERALILLAGNFANLFGDICIQNDKCKKNGKPPLFDIEVGGVKDILEETLKNAEQLINKGYLEPINAMLIRVNCYISYFHIGVLSFEELTDKLEDVNAWGKGQGIGFITELMVSNRYLNYLYHYGPYPAETKKHLADKRIREVMPNVLEMKRQQDFRFSYFVLGFLSSVSLYGEFCEFYETVLAFTVYADKALYVHTVMVKEISHLLLKWILDEKPSLVEGVCGLDVAGIREKKEELLTLMDQCAMCHDIGKHFQIEIVSNSSRRLTEDEFAIIKTHPKNFETVWDRDFSVSEEQKCIYDCALLHHRWHNGEGGYPEEPHTKNRPFVDIIAIADSLDAATDSIGRPYSHGKSLEDLIGEFLEMGGTRYNQEVAMILCRQDMKEAVAGIIQNRREEVNYQIYAFQHM